MQNKFLCIVLFFTFALYANDAFGQRKLLEKQSYFVLNLEDIEIQEANIHKQFKKIENYYIYCFSLLIIDENNELKVKLSNNRMIPLKNVFEDLLKLSMTIDLTPIFFRYDGNTELLTSFLKNYNPKKHYVSLDNNTLYNRKLRKLLLFLDNEKNINNLPPWLIDVNQHLVKSSSNIKYVPKEKIGLLIDSDLSFSKLNRVNSIDYLRQIVETWEKFGRFPSFIKTKYKNPDLEILKTGIGLIPIAHGVIEHSNTEQLKIGWKEFRDVIVSDYFCFPLYAGETTTLTPSTAGYNFSPSTISFNTNSNQDYNIKFKVKKLHINDNLKAIYRFDNNIKDATNNANGGKLIGGSFINDPIKGSVISLNNGDFVELNKLEKYDIKDKSLSLSAWVKPRSLNKLYTPILCSTEREMRKGFHFAIRNGKAYMGFWTLDLIGTTTIAENEWVHLTGTYNVDLQILTLYINGKKDAVTKGIPSFIGDGYFFVGKSQLGHFFTGCINDLTIWNRTLGEHEVANLYEHGVTEYSRVSLISRYYIIAGISILILLLILLIIFIYRKRVKSRTVTTVQEKGTQTYDYKFYLFGNFCIIDRDGNELTELLTPKIKSLFILLLLDSIESENGLTSKEIANELWPGWEPGSAMNNRRVTTIRLRKALEKTSDLTIKTKDRVIWLERPKNIWIDFIQFNSLSFDGEKEDLLKLFKLLKRGSFLQNSNDVWSENFKNSVMGPVIKNLTRLLFETSTFKEKDIQLQAIDILLMGEPINDKFMKFKVKLCREMGKLELAKSSYKQFCLQFKSHFGDEYNVTFSEIIG